MKCADWGRFLILLSLLLSAVQVFAGRVDNSNDVRMLELAGPPWEPFLFENKPRQGLATEVVVSALERAGYKVNVSIKPWRRVMAEAELGEVDVLIGLWFNEEREKSFHYSDAYYVNQISFVTTREKEFRFHGLEQLMGLRLGVRKGASFGDAFDKNEALNKLFIPSAINMLNMLALDRIDVGLDDRLILQGLMKNDSSLSDKLVFVEPAFIERPLHMAVVKSLENHHEIVSQFNQQLSRMKHTGELQRVYAKYGF